MLRLESCNSISDLHQLYRENHVSGVPQRVELLRNLMHIRATVPTECSINETPEENLFILEELALSRLWIDTQYYTDQATLNGTNITPNNSYAVNIVDCGC